MTTSAVLILMATIALSVPCHGAVPAPDKGSRFRHIGQDPLSEKTAKPGYPAFAGNLLEKIVRLQHQLNRKLSRFMRKIKARSSFRSLVLIFFLAFAYGVIHTLGPGHGKIFAFSYFLSSGTGLVKGVMMGNLVALTHSASATVLVLVPYFIARQSFHDVENFSRILKLISYGLITLIGFFLFASCLKAGLRKRGGDGEKARNSSDKGVFLMALSIGTVPCLATVIVLLFSISMDMLKLGLMLVFFMCLGAATTISAVAIAAIWLKRETLHLLKKHSKIQTATAAALGLGSSLLITATGGILFIVNLMGRR